MPLSSPGPFPDLFRANDQPERASDQPGEGLVHVPAPGRHVRPADARIGEGIVPDADQASQVCPAAGRARTPASGGGMPGTDGPSQVDEDPGEALRSGELRMAASLGSVFEDPEVGPAGWTPRLSVLSLDIETDPAAPPPRDRPPRVRRVRGAPADASGPRVPGRGAPLPDRETPAGGLLRPRAGPGAGDPPPPRPGLAAGGASGDHPRPRRPRRDPPPARRLRPDGRLRPGRPPLPLDRVASSIAAFDLLYLAALGRRGIAAPSVRAEAEIVEPQAEGHVLEPLPGLYTNAVALDFESLYPSLIRTFEVDPRTSSGPRPAR